MLKIQTTCVSDAFQNYLKVVTGQSHKPPILSFLNLVLDFQCLLLNEPDKSQGYKTLILGGFARENQLIEASKETGIGIRSLREILRGCR